MSFEENESTLTEGAIAGIITGFFHALIVGFIIAPLMYGALFYHPGPGVLGAMITELIKDMFLGAIMGAIGAYVALRRKQAR